MGMSSENASLNLDEIYVKSQGRLAAVLQQQAVDFNASEDIEELPVITADGKIIKNASSNRPVSKKQQSQPFVAPGILPPSLVVEDFSVMKLIFKQPSDCPAPPPFRGNKVKKVVKSDMDWKTVDSTVTNLEIDSNCLTGNCMSFLKASNLNSLKTLHFKDSCASSIECVTIRNNPYLTDLAVGSNCFSSFFDPNQDLYLAPEGETPRIFCVMLNFSLEHISIGRFSFTRYSTFTLARCSVCSPSRIVLPNLTTLSIGECNDSTAIEDGSFCFSFTQSFTLSGRRFIALCPLCVDLPKLATVKIGNYCFSKVWNVTLKSCSSPIV